ncbi:MAG: hypothetical protein U9N56_00450 [Actinomycetota bacterium]|nr:hypothetical protein [Actinomycetota bacterium]
MAQQPNVEIADSDRPRSKPQPGSAIAWRSSKPGLPSGPDDIPEGPGFGHAGPDPGWAYQLVRRTELPDDDPRLDSVVVGLVLARASALGRAPVPEDIDVALVLCGYAEDAGPDWVERRERWLAAVPHDQRPGATAVGEVDRELITAKPEQIRFAHRLSGKD